MMQGIVALLEGEARKGVEALWARMEHDLGIPYAFPGAVPHVTFAVGEGVELVPATAALKRLAPGLEPFDAATHSLGVFGGPTPTLFIGVTRTRELSRFQETVLKAVDGLVRVPDYHYEPKHWVPHISVARGNVPPERLGEVLGWWTDHHLAWPIRVTNLAIASNTPGGLFIHARSDLGRAPQ
jgi:2'-5' RNA ligase